MKLKKTLALVMVAMLVLLVAACAGGAQENETPLATESGLATTAAPLATTAVATTEVATTEAPMETVDATGLPETGGGTGTPSTGGTTGGTAMAGGTGTPATGGTGGTGTPAGGEMTGTGTPGADGLGTETAGGAVCQTAAPEELITQGETIYQNQCAACHGPEGAGQGTFPALASNADVGNADPAELIETLFNPQVHPFAQQMTSDQGAAALSYVRNNFGNEAEVVCPETVDEERPTQ